jgi:uncharacterized protein YbjT (DUF2867 family)
MQTRKKILVTGATGLQGGAVARSLLKKGFGVRVLTRSPEKASVLSGLGAEVARGDFEDGKSLLSACRSVDGVFLMGTPFEKGVRAEEEHGEAVIGTCREAGCPHIVYSSACGADRKTGIPHFESKRRVEERLSKAIPAYTILRPAFFMQNFEAPWILPSLQKGILSLPIHPGRTLQMVDVRDLGEVVAECFLRPNDFVGREIDLAGDQLAMSEIASRISCAMNRVVRYEPIPEERAEAAVGRDSALMYKWLDTRDFDVDIAMLADRYGLRLTSFDRYLGKSGLFRKAA